MLPGPASGVVTNHKFHDLFGFPQRSLDVTANYALSIPVSLRHSSSLSPRDTPLIKFRKNVCYATDNTNKRKEIINVPPFPVKRKHFSNGPRGGVRRIPAFQHRAGGALSIEIGRFLVGAGVEATRRRCPEFFTRTYLFKHPSRGNDRKHTSVCTAATGPASANKGRIFSPFRAVAFVCSCARLPSPCLCLRQLSRLIDSISFSISLY